MKHHHFAAIVLALAGLPTGAQAEETVALSAYYGDAVLPNLVQAICPGAAGLGGLPFVLSSGIDTMGGYLGDPNALDPALFAVDVGFESLTVTPVCATLQPAIDPSERQTILLGGDFGLGGSDRPMKISVVGDLLTSNGTNLRGLEVGEIADTDNGPSLVAAEVFDPADGLIATSGIGDGRAFCPRARTASVLKLTFSGGVSGPQGGQLTDDDAAIKAIQIVALHDGSPIVFHPFALRDDDGDNHLDACLGIAVDQALLVRVSVDSQTFYAPQNVPNMAGTVPISYP